MELKYDRTMVLFDNLIDCSKVSYSNQVQSERHGNDIGCFKIKEGTSKIWTELIFGKRKLGVRRK